MIWALSVILNSAHFSYFESLHNNILSLGTHRGSDLILYGLEMGEEVAEQEWLVIWEVFRVNKQGTLRNDSNIADEGGEAGHCRETNISKVTIWGRDKCSD